MLDIFDYLGYPLTGFGLGMILSAKYDNKFKKPSELNVGEKIVRKAAPIGAGLGMLALMAKYRLANKMYDRIWKSLEKTSALKKEVVLREYQRKAKERALNNKGRLLIAHATGSGKTLTGISIFEDLKAQGKAKRALVAVPASLAKNFKTNIEKFTDSTAEIIGPKNDRRTKSVGDKINADYAIVSYDLLRQHPEEILKNNFDTLIVDEVHRARNDYSKTYETLKNISDKMKHVLTLTGSIVNNEPQDILPLLDITYGENPFGTKNLFEKLYILGEAKKYGILHPKVYIEKRLKNKKSLKKQLTGKIDFLSHEDIKELPPVEEHTVKVKMTPQQKHLYYYALDVLDPITKLKIKYKIPVSQREVKGIFGKLIKARAISTDPAVMDKALADKDPAEYSPKIKKIIEDLQEHLKESPENRVVIYGNLVESQIKPIAKALEKRKIPYGMFAGQKVVTRKQRMENLEKFKKGEKRVLLLSPAGSEGLDIPEATMMQLVEGHYNPERIYQAEARIRRIGDKSKKKKIIKKYVSIPETDSFIDKLKRSLGFHPEGGVDEWIYEIASRKDKLNREFRNVLHGDEMKKTSGLKTLTLIEYLPHITYGVNMASRPIGNILHKRFELEHEKQLKQKLIDMGYSDLLSKKDIKGILRKGKLDERKAEAEVGSAITTLGLPMIIAGELSGIKDTVIERAIKAGKYGYIIAPALATLISGTSPIWMPLLTSKIVASTINKKDLQRGVDLWQEYKTKKMKRDYNRSKKIITEYEKMKELGLI